MSNFSKPIENLIRQLSKLPGIGQKTAQRLAFHIINMEDEDAKALSSSILEAKEKIQFCSICSGFFGRKNTH